MDFSLLKKKKILISIAVSIYTGKMELDIMIMTVDDIIT